MRLSYFSLTLTFDGQERVTSCLPSDVTVLSYMKWRIQESEDVYAHFRDNE